MPTPKCKDFRGLYDNYIGENNQTTQAELQDYHENQNTLIKEACTNFWQPLTDYPAGHIIRSSNMPAGVWAIVVKAGTSGEEEPTWDYANKSVSDGSVIWLMFYLKVTVNGIAADEEGNIELDKSDIGLDKVDNTPDLEKIVAQAGKVGDETIGGTAQPVYIKDGVPEALTGNIGGSAQPIYMLEGVLKALGITIGSASKPVYVDAGVIKACSTALGASANGGIIAQSLGTNGYVKFANGLILQWGVTTYSGCGNCFPISFTTPYAVIAEEHHKTTTATNYDGSFMTTRLTTTGFSYRAESTGYADAIMFVAFGKQRSGDCTITEQILSLQLFQRHVMLSPLLANVIMVVPMLLSKAKPILVSQLIEKQVQRLTHILLWVNKQWGKANTSSDSAITIAFPITFGTLYCVTISKRSDNTSYGAMLRTCVQSSNNASFVTRGGYQSYCDWIAAGKAQQWGKSSSSGRATTTVTLPISMASAIYAVAISQAAASDTWSTWSSIVSNTQIKLTNNYGPGSWWLVIGKQQWGTKTGASNKTITISLNITFSTTSYIPYAVDKTYGQSTSHVGLSARANNAFTINHSTDGDTVYWSAIGYQQWGYVIDGIFTFPISLNICYGAFAISNTTQSSWGRPAIAHNPTTSNTQATFQGMTSGYEQANTWYSMAFQGTGFAIGVQQWGYVQNGAAPQSVNFPISYTVSVLSIHVTPIYAGGYTPSGFVHSAITLSSVKLNAQRWDTASYHAELGTYYWTSIGVQQWGRTGGVNQDNKTNISIPISVTTMYAFVMCRFGWVNDPDNMNGNCFVSHNGGNSVTIGDGDYGCSKMYICVGVQQWGYNSNNAAGATTGFPISFASACYGVVHCSGNTGRIEGNPYITSVTTTTIKWGQYGLGYWIAFGV